MFFEATGYGSVSGVPATRRWRIDGPQWARPASWPTPCVWWRRPRRRGGCIDSVVLPNWGCTCFRTLWSSGWSGWWLQTWTWSLKPTISGDSARWDTNMFKHIHILASNQDSEWRCQPSLTRFFSPGWQPQTRFFCGVFKKGWGPTAFFALEASFQWLNP